MTGLIFSRVSIIWLVLVVATCVAWSLAEGRVLSFWAIGAIIIIAAVKIRLVFLYFMEVINMPLVWRLAFEFWVCLVTLIILFGYWCGIAS